MLRWMNGWILEDERENCTNFLKKHLYGPLGIQPEKMHLFDIHAANFKEECSRIDQIHIQPWRESTLCCWDWA